MGSPKFGPNRLRWNEPFSVYFPDWVIASTAFRIHSRLIRVLNSETLTKIHVRIVILRFSENQIQSNANWFKYLIINVFSKKWPKKWLKNCVWVLLLINILFEKIQNFAKFVLDLYIQQSFFLVKHDVFLRIHLR